MNQMTLEIIGFTISTVDDIELFVLINKADPFIAKGIIEQEVSYLINRDIDVMSGFKTTSNRHRKLILMKPIIYIATKFL